MTGHCDIHLIIPYLFTNSGYESSVNKNNAARQLAVNNVANYVGSGSGTARRDGVAGTPLGVTGRDRYSYGHGQGYGGYGHGGRGGYGYGGNYGGANYGRDGRGANYGHGGYGNYGNAGYGNAGYGRGAGYGGY